jgi:uracil-DNA glycosylase
VKCPTESKRDLGRDDSDGDEAFENCRAYLENGFDRIDPAMIVPLGDRAAERTATVLDASIEPDAIGNRGKRYDCSPPVVVAPHWDQEIQFPDKYLTAIRESLIAITECFQEIDQ